MSIFEADEHLQALSFTIPRHVGNPRHHVEELIALAAYRMRDPIALENSYLSPTTVS
jgi:hypothetical protein